MHESVSPCSMRSRSSRFSVQPRQRPDRARREQEAVGVARAPLEQALREHRRDGDPREVVVGERRVADVGRDQHLALPGSPDLELGVGEVARLEGGVDHHLVVARLAARAAAGARGRSPRSARSRRSGRGSRPAGREACAAARAAPRAASWFAPARCRRRRAGSSAGSRPPGCRPPPRCRRRGGSTRRARSSRTPGCRSGSRSA